MDPVVGSSRAIPAEPAPPVEGEIKRTAPARLAGVVFVDLPGDIVARTPLLADLDEIENARIITDEDLRGITKTKIEELNSDRLMTGLLWGHNRIEWCKLLHHPGARAVVAIDTNNPDMRGNRVLGFFNYFAGKFPPGYDDLKTLIAGTEDAKQYCLSDTVCTRKDAPKGLYQVMLAIGMQTMLQAGFEYSYDFCRLLPVYNGAMRFHLKEGWERVRDARGKPLIVTELHHAECVDERVEAKFAVLKLRLDPARIQAALNAAQDEGAKIERLG
ncbi:MAG: hypothetical protein K1X83_04655 [Oligoflexia bacterium]|nr:hypothetical protein [Oligoflexia bacterium]